MIQRKLIKCGFVYDAFLLKSFEPHGIAESVCVCVVHVYETTSSHHFGWHRERQMERTKLMCRAIIYVADKGA